MYLYSNYNVLLQKNNKFYKNSIKFSEMLIYVKLTFLKLLGIMRKEYKIVFI